MEDDPLEGTWVLMKTTHMEAAPVGLLVTFQRTGYDAPYTALRRFVCTNMPNGLNPDAVFVRVGGRYYYEFSTLCLVNRATMIQRTWPAREYVFKRVG
jgi:hypothetical protein